MKKEAIIDAVIPAYRPGAEFRELLKRLMAPSRPLREGMEKTYRWIAEQVKAAAK